MKKQLYCDIDSTVNNHWVRIKKWALPQYPGNGIHHLAFSRDEIMLDEVLPNAVETTVADDNAWAKLEAAATANGKVAVKDTKAINTNSITAYLAKAVQELSAEVDTLKTKVAALEAA